MARSECLHLSDIEAQGRLRVFSLQKKKKNGSRKRDQRNGNSHSRIKIEHAARQQLMREVNADSDRHRIESRVTQKCLCDALELQVVFTIGSQPLGTYLSVNV